MKLKRRFIKKSLADLITILALTIGSLGLLGCQNSNQPYSKLENKVYNYVNKFSQKIPKELIRNQNVYHGPNLILGNTENLNGPFVKSGKGKLVYGYPIPETIVAGYADKKEFESYDITNNHKVLNNLSFGRMIFKMKPGGVDEIIILNKKDTHVIYIKKDNKWRKGVCVGSYYRYDQACQDNIIENGEIIPEKQVQKYIDLSNKIKDTYFKRQKPKKIPKGQFLVFNVN